MQQKSDVELFWDKLKEYFPNWREWHSLHPMEQIQLVQAINMILQVVRDA